MNRRDFLKGTAGLVLACGLGFGTIDDLSRALSPTAETAVGPLLVEGLTPLPALQGADVYHQGALAFQVNSMGAGLLKYADGSHTLEEIIALSGCEAAADKAAMFFVTLGQAGYLQNRIEVRLYENRA